MIAVLFPFSLGLVPMCFSLKVRVRVERVKNSRWKADLGVVNSHDVKRASQVAPVVENPPTSAGDTREAGWILGREDPLEEGLATHSSVCLENPGTEEPGATVHEIAEIGTRLSDSAHTRCERCAGTLYAHVQT